MLGDRLRALDAEALADLADRGLVGVRAQILDHEVQDLPLDLRERLDLPRGSRRIAMNNRVGTCQRQHLEGGGAAPGHGRALS
jgi:hypothetical protein